MTLIAMQVDVMPHVKTMAQRANKKAKTKYNDLNHESRTAWCVVSQARLAVHEFDETETYMRRFRQLSLEMQAYSGDRMVGTLMGKIERMTTEHRAVAITRVRPMIVFS